MDHAFLRFPGFKDKALTLSYDDGVVQDERLIEIMTRYGLKGTFNLNSELFADRPQGRRLTKEQALALYIPSGNEVAVHGARHLSLAETDSGVGTYEIISDRKNLETMFGCVVKGMAYANGSYNDSVVETVRVCGIAYARTTVSTGDFRIPDDWLRMPATCHHRDARLMEYAEKFLTPADPGAYFWRQTPRLFYLWGHSYEFDDNDNWDVIQRFAARVGNRDDVWYATNGEIYEYVEAYRRLDFAADFTKVYNPSAKDVYIRHFGGNAVIPAGRTVELT